MSDENENLMSIEVSAEDPREPGKDSEEYLKGKDDVFSTDNERDPELDKELSEEDRQLKETLYLLVNRVSEGQVGVRRAALESLRSTIRGYTHSMTSVPKPLKFLRPHFSKLETLYSRAEKEWGNEDTSGNATGISDVQLLSDILSVLAMTYVEGRKTLEYRLKGHPGTKADPNDDPGQWGHEYMQHLAMEAGEAFGELQKGVIASIEGQKAATSTGDSQKAEAFAEEERSQSEQLETLLSLALSLVPYFLKHNAEVDAVDLLLEVEAIERIAPLVDKDTFERVCVYLVACVNLLLHPDDIRCLRTAFDIYLSFRRWTQALVLAMRLNDEDLIKTVFFGPKHNLDLQLQMAFLLGRQRKGFAIVSTVDALTPELFAEHGIENVTSEQTVNIQKALFNQNLAADLQWFAKELNILEPKKVDDIYKSNDVLTASSSRRSQNGSTPEQITLLAAMYVNSFVNVAFRNDPLITTAPAGQSFIYKLKDPAAVTACTSSLGLVQLWDVEYAISSISDFVYSSDENVRAGAVLATGLVTAGVSSEQDVVYAILGDLVGTEEPLNIRSSAVQALGIAYTQSSRSDIQASLAPCTNSVLQDPAVADKPNSQSFADHLELECNSCLAIGLLYLGTANPDAGLTIVGWFLEARPEMYASKFARFAILGLGFVYLGQQDKADAIVETLRAIDHPIGICAAVLVTACAYAGTGNVLQVQNMLRYTCETQDSFLEAFKEEGEEEGDENSKPDEARATSSKAGSNGTAKGATTSTSNGSQPSSGKNQPAPPPNPYYDLYQAFATLGVALISMGEDIGAEMAIRQYVHLMHYGEAGIRRAVPLGLALLSASNPQMPLLDTLSKYSHDADLKVAANSIFAMGIVGAGTNNARLAQRLRSLATYYSRDPDSFFTVRVAQGLLHLGKGTVGISPFHTNRSLLSPSALAGLLVPLFAFIDPDQLVFNKQHHYLFYLVLAMHPRFLITLDEKGNKIEVDVRVGQAVDTVGQAGKPRTVSGFQTHSTPVRLAYNERAELATEKYIPYSHVLENVVILAKNESYDQDLDDH